MGCSSSIDYPRKPVKTVTSHKSEYKPDIMKFDNGIKKSATEFPEEVRILIRRTWKYMESDMTKNGLGVFKRIFEYSPEVKTLFELSDVPDEQLLDHPKVKGHAARFMNAVGASVDNLDHLDDTLTHILFNLGKAHKNFSGFDSDYFDTFYMAMTAQWETVMGIKFTRDVADAWAHLFAFMMDKLKEGYYSPDG